MSDTADEPDVTTTEGFMASLSKDLGIEIQVGDAPPQATPPAPAPSVSSALEASLLEGTTDGADGGDNADADSKADDDADGEPDYKKSYEELRTLVGRMSNELGELRKAKAAPDDDDTSDFTPAPVLSVPVTDELVFALEQAIEKDGGEQVAYWALTQRPDLYETVLDTWADSETPGASRRAAEFNIRYQNALAEGEREQAAKAHQEFQANLGSALDAEVARLAPEFGITPGTEEVDKLLADTVTAAPKAVQLLVASKDEAERTEGVRIILALAAVKAPAPAPTKDGDTPDALQQALAHAKGAAAVGGGSLRPAPAPAQSGDKVEEKDILKRLQEHILAAPSTSVADGLTVGGKPLNG